MRFAVKVFYKGEKYYGYQRQPDVPTVEEQIIKALKKAGYIEKIRESNFISATRTDRNVSAIGNCFAFNTEKELKINQLNHFLPHDNSIICWAKSEVEEEFNPRYAKSKKYWYFISKAYMKENKVDVEKIEKIAKKFEGTHDFRLFAKFNEKNTIRKIDEIKVIENKNGVKIEFVAQSFLWQQIRRIVAYLMEYNKLKKEWTEVEKLLKINNKEPYIPIKPAEPKNLILVEQKYEKIKWKIEEKAVKKIIEETKRKTFEKEAEKEKYEKQWTFFKKIEEK